MLHIVLLFLFQLILYFAQSHWLDWTWRVVRWFAAVIVAVESPSTRVVSTTRGTFHSTNSTSTLSSVSFALLLCHCLLVSLLYTHFSCLEIPSPSLLPLSTRHICQFFIFIITMHSHLQFHHSPTLSFQAKNVRYTFHKSFQTHPPDSCHGLYDYFTDFSCSWEFFFVFECSSSKLFVMMSCVRLSCFLWAFDSTWHLIADCRCAVESVLYNRSTSLVHSAVK